MKIRHPWLIKALGFIGAFAVRWWIGSLRYSYRASGKSMQPQDLGPGARFIYAFWHEGILLPAYHYNGHGISVLISQHADGQLLTEVCRHLRIDIIRGSASRGGALAVRQMMRARETGSLAITPDGPRGPRRQVHPGAIYLAARTGLPIVPVGFGYDRPWRVNSWDRFAVPRPWSRCTCVTAEPIVVPDTQDKHVLEEYRQRLEKALLWAGDEAECWAEGRVSTEALARRVA